jgi:hypothetical protein
MGHWGVRSYENDEAADALDAGFDRVHGATYEELMDDRNPLTPEQIQQKLANPQTLAAAVTAFEESAEGPPEVWDEVDRLGFAGVVVRHAELGVPIPDNWRERAVAWLTDEDIEWEESTVRKLRREKEIQLLRGQPRA